MALAAVRDLRELRAPATADEIAAFETDVLSGFVLARASAGLVDSIIRNDVNRLELIRDWLGRPLWEMQPGRFLQERPLDVFSQGVGDTRADAVDDQLYFHSNCLPSDLPSWTVYSNMTAIPLRRLSSSPLVS